MTNIEGIKDLFKNTQLRLDKKCGFTPSDRFHSVLVTDGIMGLMVAKHAGLINFDIPAVVKWVVGVTSGIKEQSKAMDVDAETTLVNFISENYNNILRIKSTDDARSKTDLDHLVIPDATPRVSFIIRYEYEIGRAHV